MKIAYFTDTYLPQLNGVATSVDYFAKSLRQANIKVYIFAPKIKGYKDQEEDIFRIPSSRVLPTLPDSVRIPLPVPHKTLLKILKLDCDLIHAHGNGFFSLLGYAVARAKKIPYTLTFHTQFDKYTHYLFNGKFIKPELVTNLMFRRFGNICDGCIAPSQKMKDTLISAGVKKDIAVIPNFIDIKKFKFKRSNYLKNKLKIPQKSPILLSVGRLGKEKNFEFLLHVFQKIAQSDPLINLVIVGEGLDYHKLKTLGENLNLGNRFHLTGGIPADDMPKVYNSCDIFVFPSNTETQGVCIMEAASCQLPLVVADDEAYLGIVIDNKNGYLLPLKEEAFVKKILFLLRNPDSAKKMGKNSSLQVKNNFNERLLRRKLIYFYEKTIREYKNR